MLRKYLTIAALSCTVISAPSFASFFVQAQGGSFNWDKPGTPTIQSLKFNEASDSQLSYRLSLGYQVDLPILSLGADIGWNQLGKKTFQEQTNKDINSSRKFTAIDAMAHIGYSFMPMLALTVGGGMANVTSSAHSATISNVKHDFDKISQWNPEASIGLAFTPLAINMLEANIAYKKMFSKQSDDTKIWEGNNTSTILLGLKLKF